jgi:hypothetical protein
MFDMLAQVASRGPEYYGTLIGTAFSILLAGGGAGAIIHRKITHRNDRLNDERDERTERQVCPLHDSTMQLLQERKDTADEDRKEIKLAVHTLGEKTSKGFEMVFTKLDKIDAYVRNGNG